MAAEFRKAGINTELNLLERGMGAQMKHAARTSEYVAVIGNREAEAGTVTLKNLESGEQKEYSLDEAVAEVK